MINFFTKFSFIKVLKNSLLTGVLLLIMPNSCYAVSDDDAIDTGDVAQDIIEVEDEVEYENLELPEVFFKAINPGYKTGDLQNVGEMIEICRRNSDTLLPLAGAAVGYTNSSGNDSVLLNFPENSWLAGECILLRLAGSSGGELASMNYAKTLAFKGGLYLMFDDEIVDEVCWSGKEGCYKSFDSSKPTTLVRNLVSGEFEHLAEYEPEFDKNSYYEIEPNEGAEVEPESGAHEEETTEDIVEPEIETVVEESEEEQNQCLKLRFSEILTYYFELQSEQFIEIFNESDEITKLDGCKIKYKEKLFELKGEVEGKNYYVYKSDELKLTKNPVKQNSIELIGNDGEVVDLLEYYNGQKKGASLALVQSEDEEEWVITYFATPGIENVYQKFRSCEEGKVINELTGNCVKETVEIVKICPEGYFLNEATGRCKKEVVEIEKICKEGYYLNESTGRCRKEDVEVERICKEGYYLNESTGRCRKIVVETVKTCNDGYFLNPLTGRCNKIQEETKKTCKEGYYLNEETGRCRKLKENDGADYALEPKDYEEKTSFVALYAVLLVIGIAIVYIVFQFRKEIMRFIKKIIH